MAITPVAVYTDQTLSAAAEVALAPTKTDVSSLSQDSVIFSVTLTNGSTAPFQGREVTLFAAFSEDDSLTGATVVNTLMSSARRVMIRVKGTASGENTLNSTPMIVTGSNMYTWINHDTLGQAVTLNASYVGINSVGLGSNGVGLNQH